MYFWMCKDVSKCNISFKLCLILDTFEDTLCIEDEILTLLYDYGNTINL